MCINLIVDLFIVYLYCSYIHESFKILSNRNLVFSISFIRSVKGFCFPISPVDMRPNNNNTIWIWNLIQKRFAIATIKIWAFYS